MRSWIRISWLNVILVICPLEEPAIFILLKGHAVKLPSKHLYLNLQIQVTVISSQKASFAMDRSLWREAYGESHRAKDRDCLTLDRTSALSPPLWGSKHQGIWGRKSIRTGRVEGVLWNAATIISWQLSLPHRICLRSHQPKSQQNGLYDLQTPSFLRSFSHRYLLREDNPLLRMAPLVESQCSSGWSHTHTYKGSTNWT